MGSGCRGGRSPAEGTSDCDANRGTAMSAQPQVTALPPRRDDQVSDAQRASSVTAKLLPCLLPEFDYASVTVLDSTGAVSSWGQTGDLATDLDRLQYESGEGPCFDSLTGSDAVVVPYIHLEERWRRYVPAAAQLGLKSQVATALWWRDKPIGSLNLYSTTHAQVGATVPTLAVAIAGQVASALASFHEVENLQRALDTRTVLGQATGLVMARFDIDADQAFAYLRRLSMHRNQKLTAVATEVVRTRQLPVVPIS